MGVLSATVKNDSEPVANERTENEALLAAGAAAGEKETKRDETYSHKR